MHKPICCLTLIKSVTVRVCHSPSPWHGAKLAEIRGACIQAPPVLAAFAYATHQLVPLACKYYEELLDEEVAEVSHLPHTANSMPNITVLKRRTAGRNPSKHILTVDMYCRSVP
jgi:hypothetical protein